MPLDPNLILQGAAPLQQQPNMLAQYAQVQQVQQNRLAMHAQQQAMMLGAVKQKAAELDLSQQQLAATQQSQISQLLAQNKGDVTATIAQARAAGNPLADTLEKNKNAADELIAKQHQAAAAAQKDEVETNLKKVSQAADALGTLKDTSDELKPIYYQTLRQQAIAAKMPGAEQLPLTWTPQAAQLVDALHGQALTAKDRIEAGLKKQAEAEAARHNVTEEQLTAARDYNTNQNEGLNRQSLNQYRGAELGLRGKQLGIEGARLGLEQSKFKQDYGAGGEGAGSTPLPGAMETIAQQVANGEKKLPRGMKGYNAIAMRAQFINPSLGDQTYSTVQSYLSSDGKANQQLGGITRVLGHMEQFQEDSGKVGNSVATSLGMNIPSNAGLRKTSEAISKELGRLVEQQAITESDKKTWMSGLDSGVKATRDATLESMRKILGSQFEVNFHNYEKATGSPLPVGKMFDKPTQQRLARFYPELTQGQQAQPPASGGKRPSLDSIFGGMK